MLAVVAAVVENLVLPDEVDTEVEKPEAHALWHGVPADAVAAVPRPAAKAPTRRKGTARAERGAREARGRLVGRILMSMRKRHFYGGAMSRRYPCRPARST